MIENDIYSGLWKDCCQQVHQRPLQDNINESQIFVNPHCGSGNLIRIFKRESEPAWQVPPYHMGLCREEDRS